MSRKNKNIKIKMIKQKEQEKEWIQKLKDVMTNLEGTEIKKKQQATRKEKGKEKTNRQGLIGKWKKEE